MTEKSEQLGTCYYEDRVPHSVEFCRLNHLRRRSANPNWCPSQPAATQSNSTTVIHSKGHDDEGQNLEKCPTCHGYHAGGCHREGATAARPEIFSMNELEGFCQLVQPGHIGKHKRMKGSCEGWHPVVGATAEAGSKLGPIKTDPKLTAALEADRNHVMSDKEKEAQKKSWVKGEMGMGSDADEAREREKLRTEAGEGKPPQMSAIGCICQINQPSVFVEEYLDYREHAPGRAERPAGTEPPALVKQLEEARETNRVLNRRVGALTKCVNEQSERRAWYTYAQIYSKLWIEELTKRQTLEKEIALRRSAPERETKI